MEKIRESEGCLLLVSDDSFEAGTRRSSVMLGVLHMALLNELFGRKFKLTSLCVCTFVIAASRSLGLC